MQKNCSHKIIANINYFWTSLQFTIVFKGFNMEESINDLLRKHLMLSMSDSRKPFLECGANERLHEAVPSEVKDQLTV